MASLEAAQWQVDGSLEGTWEAANQDLLNPQASTHPQDSG